MGGGEVVVLNTLETVGHGNIPFSSFHFKEQIYYTYLEGIHRIVESSSSSWNYFLRLRVSSSIKKDREEESGTRRLTDLKFLLIRYFEFKEGKEKGEKRKNLSF